MSFSHYNKVMDIALLKTFLVLAKTKNFTKAASLLHRSQSAISLQIVKLEKLVGKALFERTKRAINLTTDGEILLGYAQRMIDLEEELLNHFHAGQIKGEVSLGAPEDIATQYLPEIFANFVKNYPEITLNVNCEFTLNLLNGFEAGVYDLIIIKQDPKKPHPQSINVWKEKLVWVTGKPQKTFETQEEPLPLILAPSPCVYRKRAIDALTSQGIRWKIVYTSPSLTGTFTAVRAGLGVSILPRNMVPKDLYVLKKLPHLQDTQIGILRRENGSQAALALSSFIVSHLTHAFVC